MIGKGALTEIRYHARQQVLGREAIGLPAFGWRFRVQACDTLLMKLEARREERLASEARIAHYARLNARWLPVAARAGHRTVESFCGLESDWKDPEVAHQAAMEFLLNDPVEQAR